MYDINLPVILAAALVAVASPGPATLAIAGTSMSAGRRSGLALASGVTTGSLIWSIAAALGLSAAMAAHAWVFEVIRYLGGAYLIFLAYRSGRAALTPGRAAPAPIKGATAGRMFAKGLALHLTNPKAVLFFGSLYAVGVPADTPTSGLALIICAVGLQSFLVLHLYALLLSNSSVAAAYMHLRRWFEGGFAAAFGLAGLKVLTARMPS